MNTGTNKENPLISVIMPTYNGASFIQEAIFSVLKQTYTNLEILLCDDLSQDATVEIVQEIKKKYDPDNKIQIIRQRNNQGISKNMNTGLEAANGKYIAILDQDDFRRNENKVVKQVTFLETNTEHKIVGTNAIFDMYGNQQKKIYPKNDEQIRKVILGSCPMLHSSVMYDKEIVKKIGGYTESYKYAMDYKLFLDFMKESKGANLSDETTYYRRHGNNTSILKGKEQKIEATTIRKEHKKDFPNRTRSMIAYRVVSLLNEVLGNNPRYAKVKNEAKRIYRKVQNNL